MRSAVLLAALLACLCGVGGARLCAQEPADCAGVVVDENGVHIAAAKITLQMDGGGMFRAESDGAGRFTLRSLPTGDYKVEARKEGFFVVAGEPLSLRSGMNELTLTLQHAEELHEQVQVTATPNQIDPQDTAQRESWIRDRRPRQQQPERAIQRGRHARGGSADRAFWRGLRALRRQRFEFRDSGRRR